MNKVIFLDIDGVLNCFTSKSRCGGFLGIDKDKVECLAKIVQGSNAIIVLSSTWRDGWQPFGRYKFTPPKHVKYLNNNLWKKGKLLIMDATPDIAWSLRGMEISTWLNNHPQVEKWVVLDDEMFEDFCNNPQIEGHLVLTSMNYGLTDNDVKKALEILND